MFGAGGGTSSYEETHGADVIVLWGSNARETHPIFFHHVLKGVRNGAKLYVVGSVGVIQDHAHITPPPGALGAL